MRRALVVGSEGQDGRIACDRLRAEGSETLGVDRDLDILDRDAVAGVVSKFRPDELYYLAAVHHSATDRESMGGRDLYASSHRVHVEGLLNFLEAMRLECAPAHLVYAASSLVFGEPSSATQDESTPMAPVDVYGITKTTGIHCCRLYRGRGVRASVGILYTHESPLRKPDFVSQKIVRAAVDIRKGRASKLILGDLSAVNDWGWAGDTVDAMMRIARLDAADDFVVATGEAHTVADLVEAVFDRAGLDWKEHVEEDRSMIARRRRSPLIGDASKLRARTGWTPKVGFEEMAGLLWEAAWARAENP